MLDVKYKHPFRRISLALTVFLWSSANAGAQPPLGEVVELRNGIIAIGIAYELSEKCQTLDARIFRGLNYLSQLRSRARQLGYSEEEIDAYVNDKDEQARLERMARDEIARFGVVEDQPETYCRVGRAQIAQNTLVGWLLR